MIVYVCYTKKLTLISKSNLLPFGNRQNSGNLNVTNGMQETIIEQSSCPVTATIALIGGRWKTIILYILSSRTRRFGEIAVRMPTISRKVLTEQLKELEADGLISRKQFKEIPPRVEYTLTDLGRSLKPILDDIAAWGKERAIATRVS